MQANSASISSTSKLPELKSGVALNSPLEPNLKKLNHYLKRVHRRGWYTNFGQLHEELTEKLSERFKVENLLLVNNGTMALQVAAKVLGLKHVITTPYSFAATSSAMQWQEVKLNYADIDPESLNLATESVEKKYLKGTRCDGILPVHLYGNPCNVEGFQQIAEKYSLKILYDAAQTFGVTYKGKSMLDYGDASAISFHATKLFHTVEGGAICFKNKSDCEKAKSLLNFGFSGSELGPEGINGKLSEYHAAVGLTLLDDLDSVIEHRVELFERYQNNLSDYVELPKWMDLSNQSGNYFAIILKNSKKCSSVMRALTEAHCQSRIYFQIPLHRRYGDESDKCPIAESIIDRTLTLPLHAHMSLKDVDSISAIVAKNA